MTNNNDRVYWLGVVVLNSSLRVVLFIIFFEYHVCSYMRHSHAPPVGGANGEALGTNEDAGCSLHLVA